LILSSKRGATSRNQRNRTINWYSVDINNTYTRLTLTDREEISRGMGAKERFATIARRLGRPTSTVSREVWLNVKYSFTYRAERGEERAQAVKHGRPKGKRWTPTYSIAIPFRRRGDTSLASTGRSADRRSPCGLRDFGKMSSAPIAILVGSTCSTSSR